MERYIDDFLRVTSMKGKYLTTFGFNEESVHSSIAIIKKLNSSWGELLSRFGLLEDLYDYAVEEYKIFAYKNEKANSTSFTKNHRYLKQYIFASTLDIKRVRERAGFINECYKGSYNSEMLRENFNNVMDKVKGIPSITQFIQHSVQMLRCSCTNVLT